MGYEMKQAGLMASVSRHNSPRDVEHDALWAEVRAKLREIEADPRYQEINLMSSGLGEDDE